MNSRAAKRNWFTGLFIALAILTPLIYLLATHNIWEDFLITFRHSKNLVEGKGLVFTPGRYVQGFTSAINVMLPAGFYALTGGGESGMHVALNLYRLVSLAAFVIGGLVLLRLMLDDESADFFSPIVFILLYVTEAKTVAFSTNGQESAFMVCFLSLGFVAAVRGFVKHWRLALISFTGLLYTRPDSPIFIGALLLVGFIHRIEAKPQLMRSILKSAGIAALIFAPWFIWAWIYYGQPIPNTAIAKSHLTGDDFSNPAKLIRWVLQDYLSVAGWLFSPIYYSFGGWPEKLLDPYGLLCGVICTIYWLIPGVGRTDRLGKMASLAFTLTALYMAFVDIGSYACPWYLPSAAIFGTLTLARVPVELVRAIPKLRPQAVIVGRVVQGVIVLCSLTLFICQTFEMSVQQSIIEDTNRTAMGKWLGKVVRPEQNIYLEPIGYVGYYSDRWILDWPGLVAPEIVRIRKAKNVDSVSILLDVMPDWAVLRDFQYNAAINLQGFRDNYTVVQLFDVREKLAEYKYLPGRGFLNGDAIFVVCKRNNVVPAIGITP